MATGSENPNDRAASLAEALPEPMFGMLTGRRTVAVCGEELIRRVREALAARLGVAVENLSGSAGPEADWSLVNEGRLEEPDLLKIYADVTGLPVADEQEIRDVEPMAELTYDFLAASSCVPLAWTEDSALLAVSHPYDVGRLAQYWRAMFDSEASFTLVRRPLIERFLTGLYDATQGEDEEGDWEGDASEQTLRDLAREAPIVRLVNDVFHRAQEMGASDIHVEPSENEVAVRYRIDGVLQTVLTAPKAQYAAIASRLKLLAGMNIAERRLPQDGRIDLQIGSTQLDVRVSTVPSMHGESIVLRLLQKDVTVFDLDKVGLAPDIREELERLFLMPHGMILVVGPTGSGKTTTLYCIMRILNSDTRKIITIEDPVEYQLPGLTQIQVRSQIGLTFANGLRSIVRQDPDVILVGEIRDRETAEIAIHAALTGHLVLSTLHTNDAAGAVSRLLEMGVEGFLISSALLGVVSQRLVRRICTECGGSGRIAAPEGENSASEAASSGGKRCRNCLGNGYRGRVGIFEMLLMNDEIRRAINDHRDSTEIAAIARRHGMRTLREDGLEKVRRGITTEAEVTRVCQFDLGE